MRAWATTTVPLPPGALTTPRFLLSPNIRYLATIVGFWVVSRPFLGFNSAAGIRTADRSELMEDYYKSGRMLLRLAAAVRRRHALMSRAGCSRC